VGTVCDDAGMTENETETLSICVDCLFFHACGTTPEDWGDIARGAFLARVTHNLEGCEVYGTGDEIAEFSKGSCDSCGSTLHGSRHELFVKFPEEG
jgi:hypothetical protein